MKSTTQEPSSPALVVNRWNSWVQVWFPETDETTWIDLAETGFAPMGAGGGDALSPEGGPSRN